MSLEYIRKYYRVPAKRGGRVKYQGKPGVIKKSYGQYLRIRLDGEKHIRICHPTWEMEYLNTEATTDATREKK